MGYRSEVRSCIYGEPELLDSFIASRKLIDDVVFSDKDEGFKNDLKIISKELNYRKQTIKILDLYGENWKWYDEYEYVKAWVKLLEEAELAGLSYEFMRVGEESGDIEYESGGDVEGFLYSSTQIVCDYD